MGARTTKLAILVLWAALFTSFRQWESPVIAQMPDGRITRNMPWEESEKLTRALTRVVDFPGIDDPKLELVEVLGRLEKQYDLTFDLDYRAFKAAKLDNVLKTRIAADIRIPPARLTLATLLKRILARIPCKEGAIYVVRRDMIEFTTPTAWLRELGLPANTDLGSLVKLQFRRMELKKALESIDEVLIDVRVEKQAKTRVSARLYYVPAETAVTLLADMAGLAVVRREGAFYFTSPDNAARMKKERNRSPPTNWRSWEEGHGVA